MLFYIQFYLGVNIFIYYHIELSFFKVQPQDPLHTDIHGQTFISVPQHFITSILRVKLQKNLKIHILLDLV